MLLPDKFVKRSWPHARSERLGLTVVFGFGSGEEGHFKFGMQISDYGIKKVNRVSVVGNDE